MRGLFLRILPVMVILSIILSSCALLETQEPSATSVVSLSDDVWDRITANNKIVVGMAWDYPPFSSVDSNFQVVGFDIALIREIGSRLNIPVEVQNFPFQGLRGALQINQVDLAVAAISITPERAGQMTFSPVYYVNQTAILARADSPITKITAVNQLASFRIGVQGGSTYESWVRKSLVDTKMMTADRLFSYMEAEDAVRDLIDNRIDLVVIGQATASFYSSHNGLQVVGKGFEQQNLAVAMRLATPRLKAEIDRVMDAMLTDGTILRLIQQYIQSDVSGALPTQIPPAKSTPTRLPPVPTATPPPCYDAMKFVADVNYDDNNMKNPPLLKPGEGFVKVWRLQNSGTCTWTPNYRLVYAYGNVESARMNGLPVSIPGNVAPGNTVDVGVTLYAPQVPYTYQGFWHMENPKGERFGQSIWVGISTQSDQYTSEQPTGNYCEAILTAPMKPLITRKDFDAVWLVKNTSGKEWKADSVYYKYVSGTAMHNNDAYNFIKTIQNGESVNIIVDMLAPDKAGTYTAKWAIVSNNSTLCNLIVTVTVQ